MQRSGKLPVRERHVRLPVASQVRTPETKHRAGPERATIRGTNPRDFIGGVSHEDLELGVRDLHRIAKRQAHLRIGKPWVVTTNLDTILRRRELGGRPAKAHWPLGILVLERVVDAAALHRRVLIEWVVQAAAWRRLGLFLRRWSRDAGSNKWRYRKVATTSFTLELFQDARLHSRQLRGECGLREARQRLQGESFGLPV
mmetsp:Transcript_48031/g.134063  ORF Transcript_48031/g.134063 Transcript_48031/m.134063 type:complete len:200 (+) Transcript_48031:1307-1906(+)